MSGSPRGATLLLIRATWSVERVQSGEELPRNPRVGPGSTRALSHRRGGRFRCHLLPITHRIAVTQGRVEFCRRGYRAVGRPYQVPGFRPGPPGRYRPPLALKHAAGRLERRKTHAADDDDRSLGSLVVGKFAVRPGRRGAAPLEGDVEGAVRLSIDATRELVAPAGKSRASSAFARDRDEEAT